MPKNKTNKLDTKLALILAAEKLFTELGINGPSEREINKMANQRNQAAMKYHFGSREAIVKAILEYRTTPLNDARLAMIDAKIARSPNGHLDIRDVAESLVEPLANYALLQNSESYYARFLGRLIANREMFKAVSNTETDKGLVLCLDEYARLKQGWPREIIRSRFSLCLNLLITTMAMLEDIKFQKGARFEESLAKLRITNLIDSITNVLDAPISSHTFSHIEAIDTRKSQG
ncbi:MAG: hypothetical protein KKC30_04035 [Proteobacteria bacterium]|nr:hypothetical protein [Pseudomonadota bacterium]MBU4383928.1 hypothetical protein [Pseudomonadota bacterium]MCG2763568.1 hypothetical protein [Desulfarculaceae bacterium]